MRAAQVVHSSGQQKVCRSSKQEAHRWDGRIGFAQSLDQVRRVTLLRGANEGDGGALVAGAPRAAHTVYVVLVVVRRIIVYHEHLLIMAALNIGHCPDESLANAYNKWHICIDALLCK